MTPRSFGLAKLIEGASAHHPKVLRHHVADEYADLGDRWAAAELRRHLRGCAGDFVAMNRHRG